MYKGKKVELYFTVAHQCFQGLDHGILRGITRTVAFEAIKAQALTVEERAFTLEEAYNAREAFITSASQIVLPVVSIDGRVIGEGKPGPIAYPNPAEVSETIQNMQVVNLPTLIQLKLAAGRHYDFGDVVHLIQIHGLDESFKKKLHPAVHRDFIECLDAKRRDEYNAKAKDARAKADGEETVEIPRNQLN